MKAFYVRYRPEYISWANMKSRCFNVNLPSYKNYGGMGVKVCERWRTDFKLFLEDMGPKPQKNYHLHRVNTDGDYRPENCVWIDPTEHAIQPQRPHLFIEGRGRKLTERQKEVLKFIVNCERIPSYRDIASYFGMSSKGAFDHVQALIRKGQIAKIKGQARSFKVVE